ncbi:cyclase family protein [Amycolatopsis sp. NPDC003676]
MALIDLSSPIDAAGWEPDPVSHDVLSPAAAAQHMADEMRAHFGIEFDPAVLPGGELLSLDTLSLTTHTGTHVDAPSHYGSAAVSAARPRHIDELPLSWFHGAALTLDLTGEAPGAVGAAALEKRFAALGREPRPGELVLLHTGADARAGTPAYFTEFTGLDHSAVTLLLDHGVRVIGTDAFSLDAPFTWMIEQFRSTGDRGVLWPAHFAGRTREYCQIERLANLGALPAQGFTVSCFPVKVKGAGAGWARAVAFVD